MSSGEEIAISVYEGPNLIAPFAAVVAEFSNPYRGVLRSGAIKDQLGNLFKPPVLAAIDLADENVDFPSLAAALSVAWQETDQPLGLTYIVSQTSSGTSRIAVGYFNPDKGQFAVRAGIELAKVLFESTAHASMDFSQVRPLLAQTNLLAHSKLFGTLSYAYLKAAKLCGVPVYQVAPGSNALSYGQGVRGIRFSEATNQRDSITGHKLSQSKAESNRLIWRLGFPGVVHDVVRTLSDARGAVARLGGPLVVKPVDRNGATGVTVGIESEAEIETAFELAKQLSLSGAVLVERFVPGDEYRISVFGGKFLRTSRLVPPTIVADGEHSVAELIAADNVRRRREIAQGAYLYELSIDAKMIALLRKQGFALADCPDTGTRLRLAGTSNLKSGGHREDATDTIHPDNVAMAEAIARNFHLDAAGVDFITPDIARSWTETPCSIIEVNSNPGSGDEVTIEIMRAKFPQASDARIPTVLLVDGTKEITDQICTRLGADGKKIGQTNAAETWLGGQKRFVGAAELPARILGLLLDVNCEALVVKCNSDDITNYGLPHTSFDLALIASEQALSADVQQLVMDGAKTCVTQTPSDPLDEKNLGLIDAL